ncbi:hypothetical protein AOLI_G00103080 [Acnodon oligacanthus]
MLVQAVRAALNVVILGRNEFVCPHRRQEEENVDAGSEVGAALSANAGQGEAAGPSQAGRAGALMELPVVSERETPVCGQCSARFRCFWEQWKAEKVHFENLRQRWEMGKTQIRMFCQQYTASSSTRARLAVQALEREICSLELELTTTFNSVLVGKLQQKRKALGVYLNEMVKAALLLQGLPRLDSASSTELDSHLTLQDLTAAVGQVKAGRSPCIDGLPSDFYKHFWACIGGDCYEDTKLGHLMSSGSAAMSERTGIRSGRLLDQVMAEVQGSLPAEYLSFLNDQSVIAQWREGSRYDFPELTVSPAGEWTEDERCLLSFTTPVLGTFSLVGRRALYLLCVKVSQAHFLDGVLSTKWSELFGADSSPQGCWRVLYKRPIDKRTADLSGELCMEQ